MQQGRTAARLDAVIPLDPPARVRRDNSGALRSWFMLDGVKLADPGFDAASLARRVLRSYKAHFGWRKEITGAEPQGIVRGSAAVSARFRQEHHGVPVEAGEILLDFYLDGRLYAIYNNYQDDLDQDLDPRPSKGSLRKAESHVVELFSGFDVQRAGKPSLVVVRTPEEPLRPFPFPVRPEDRRGKFRERAAAYFAMHRRGEDDAYHLAWDVQVGTTGPLMLYRVLVDAHTGLLLDIRDEAQYADADVFDPNPVVTSGNLVRVSLPRLNPPAAGAAWELSGSWAEIKECDSPVEAPPTSQSDFLYSAVDWEFPHVMAYYHIARFQDYLQQSLGLLDIGAFPVEVDARGQSDGDGSAYSPGAYPTPAGTYPPRISFGRGVVPDAADADIILHEYGHLLQDNPIDRGGNPGLGTFYNKLGGVNEGFADFVPAVFHDEARLAANMRGTVMAYGSDGGGRTYMGESGVPAARRFFGDPEWAQGDAYVRGALWCATMFELYRKLGGDSAFAATRLAARDLVLRLHLEANRFVPRMDTVDDQNSGMTAAKMAEQIWAADNRLGLAGWRYPDGLHLKVIYDTFRKRGLGLTSVNPPQGYPGTMPVDLFVFDGRPEGGYGSGRGNDLFHETLFKDAFWETPDIWVSDRVNSTDPQDHVNPAVGQPAHLFTRVRNREASTAGSGSFTVRAFHNQAGIGLNWPGSWIEILPSVTVPAGLAPGASQVVGPFTWTPQHSHECLLVIVECASDKAITQSLAQGISISPADVVPFDNNIAQRNLFLLQALEETRMQFLVENPASKAQRIELHASPNFPPGWDFSVNPVDLRLEGGKRAEVELKIVPGPEPFTCPDKEEVCLTLTGNMEGRLLGGLTFYFGKRT